MLSQVSIAIPRLVEEIWVSLVLLNEPLQESIAALPRRPLGFMAERWIRIRIMNASDAKEVMGPNHLSVEAIRKGLQQFLLAVRVQQLVGLDSAKDWGALLGFALQHRGLGCELEIHALNNIVYDLERFGMRFVASPRHADVLLVTGPVTTNMREALERTYAPTPGPKWVVVVGDCARNGAVFAGSYACAGGVSAVLPVDLHIQSPSGRIALPRAIATA
jgi:Ni,Fe-hydrogenase III small subunit